MHTSSKAADPAKLLLFMSAAYNIPVSRDMIYPPCFVEIGRVFLA